MAFYSYLSTKIIIAFITKSYQDLFGVRSYINAKNYLLVRKDALLDYLKTHHKKILWYVLGEKNIIGLHSYNNIPNLPMWLVVSGTYTLDEEGKVTGCMRTSHER